MIIEWPPDRQREVVAIAGFSNNTACLDNTACLENRRCRFPLVGAEVTRCRLVPGGTIIWRVGPLGVLLQPIEPNVNYGK